MKRTDQIGGEGTEPATLEPGAQVDPAVVGDKARDALLAELYKLGRRHWTFGFRWDRNTDDDGKAGHTYMFVIGKRGWFGFWIVPVDAMKVYIVDGVYLDQSGRKLGGIANQLDMVMRNIKSELVRRGDIKG